MFCESADITYRQYYLELLTPALYLGFICFNTLAMTGQLYTTLELLERLVEAEVTGFQLFDQGFQFFQGFFKIG